MKKTPFLLLLFILALLPGTVSGAQGPDANAPIHVEADRMVSKQKENSVIFTGNVEATQSGLIIHSDEMTVFHQKQTETEEKNGQFGSQKIQKLYADGNVEIIQGGMVATGNHMEFFADDRKVLITGNTKVWQDNNLVTGERIMLDLNTQTTIIEPDKASGGRVKAFFYPDEK